MNYMNEQQHEHEPAKPLQAARERRRLASRVYRMKPLALGISGVFLISLLALLYLNEVGLAIQANQRLQQLAGNEAQLQQENQDLRQRRGTLQSPAYIENRASQMGMVPADPTMVHIITIPGRHIGGSKRSL